jgi:type VI secretion system protein ImpE
VTPLEFLAAGELTAALDATDPLATAPTERLLRAELLALAGGFRGAAGELRGLRSDDPAWPPARRRFLHLLRAAHRRARGAKPVFLAEAPRHAKRLRRAARQVAAGDFDAAVRSADAAARTAPHIRGHVDGREFDGLRDADDRFVSVCEFCRKGEYVWLPWEQIARITLTPGKHPLDRAFRPARVRLNTGEELDGHLPLIYPGDPGDDALRLGLDSDLAGEQGFTLGLGGKVLLLGEEELLLGDVRQIDVRV